jgi:hypothetical protein
MTLVSHSFLIKHYSTTQLTITDGLNLRGIGKEPDHPKEVARFTVKFSATVDEKPVLASLQIEVYIVEDLPANLLMGMDTLARHGINLLLASPRPRALIESCQNAEVELTARSKGRRATPRPVYADRHTTIPSNTTMQLPVRVKSKLPKDRDFLFTPRYGGSVALFSHVVDAGFAWIQVTNPNNKDWTISRHARVGLLSDFEDTNQQNIGHQNEEDYSQYSYHVMGEKAVQTMDPAFAVLGANPSLERKLENGITVYSEANVQDKFIKLLKEFDDIFHDKGFANIPIDQWMRINMKPEWEETTRSDNKVYFLGPKDRTVVDKTHDRLHEQGRLGWQKGHSPCSHPAFVIWRKVDGPNGPQMKGRVVSDIRALNRRVKRDMYPMPRQEDMIAMLAGKKYITVMDCVNFFFQWRVHPADRK